MAPHNDIEDLDYDILHGNDDDDHDLDVKQEEIMYNAMGGDMGAMDQTDPIFTVDNLKAVTIWFLERFTVKVTFDDVMMALTLFVLFGSDFAQLAVDPDHDDVFNILFTVSLGFFCFEFIAVTFAKTEFSTFRYVPYAPAGPPPDGHEAWPEFLNALPHFPTFHVEGYLFSFYWKLDLLSILSLCTDVPWIANPLGIDSSITGSSNVTKAGRVVRLVRLVRLLRLYKIFVEKQKKIKQERKLMKMVRTGQIGYHEMESQRALQDLRQSRLSTQLSTSITRKVIIMILIMLIILPLLSYSGSGDRSVAFATKLLHKFNINENINNSSKSAVLNTTLEYTRKKWLPMGYTLMIQMEPFVNGYARYDPGEIENTRDEYQTEFKHTTYNSVSGIDYLTASIQSKRPFANQDAMYSMLLTVFVGIMIIGGAFVFTSDAETNVLKPIERMTKMVEQVAANPLAPLVLTNPDESGDGGYETKLLEAAISKITGLLSVGFGEAGAGIISANLSSSSSTIDPLLPGVRVYALFGFCDIHKFEEVNNKLGNDVLVFVNTIAEIVHSNVHSWGGQCNKNLGNAFVLVWRVGDEEQLMMANDMSIMKRKRNNTSMADMRQASMSSPMAAMSMSSPPSRFSTRAGAGLSSKSPFSPYGGQNASSRVSYLDQADDDDGDHSEYDRFEENKEKVATQRPAMDLRRVPGVDVIAHGALIGFLKVIAEINRSASVLKYRREPRLTRLPPGDSDAKHFSGSSSNPMALPGTLHLHFKETRAAVRRTKVAAFHIIELLQLPNPGPIPEHLVDCMLEDWEIAVIAREEKEDAIIKAAAANAGSRSVVANDVDEASSSFESSANRRASTLAIKHSRKEKDSPRSVDESKKQRRDSFASSSSESATEEEDEMHEEFKVRMGFGLHAGWAIEGAVGSLFKVDATYLSPHVNMAARLETSSKQYGVPLLMSHLVYELLNPSVQQRCRKLDVVTVKGSEVPIGIYTYDCFQEQIFQTMNSFITAGTGVLSSPGGALSQKTARRDSIRSNDSGGSAKRRDSVQSQGSDSSSRPGSPAVNSDSAAIYPPPPPSPQTSQSGTPGGGGGSKSTPSQSFRKKLVAISEDNSSQAVGGSLHIGQSPTQFTSNPSLKLRVSTSGSATSTLAGGRPTSVSNATAPKGTTPGSLMLMNAYPEVASKIAFAHPAQLTNLNSADIFKYDVDLLQLRLHVANAEQFQTTFEKGVEAYIKGSWDKAFTLLSEANQLMKDLQKVVVESPLYRQKIDFSKKRDRAAGSQVSEHSGGGVGGLDMDGIADLLKGDGPSHTLLEYIKEHDKQAPADWQGFRPLTSK